MLQGTRVAQGAGKGLLRFPSIRKILVSVKFVSAILGPEMGAPILWTPGKMRSFCRKTHVHKIPRFGGGGVFWVWGGGSADFIFMGARIFLIQTPPKNSDSQMLEIPATNEHQQKSMWESAKVSQKRVFALLTPEFRS